MAFKDKKIIRFPSTLAKDKHPYIKFRVKDPDIAVEEIALYMPSGLAFADGASYGTINLGRIGSAIAKGGNIIDSAVSVTKEIIDRNINNFATNGSSLVAGAIVSKVPGASFSSAKEVYDFTQQKIVNPYTNVTFTGTAPRAFTFNFKLIPDNRADALNTKSIIDLFRKHLYPIQRDGAILKYPKKFEITFWVPDLRNGDILGGDIESLHLPKLYECFLTSLNVTYNGTASTFFEDGSPSEVDISLSFQETKALTQNDIIALESKKIQSVQDIGT